MDTAFADDVLCGADEIAAFLYGDAKQRRRVFYLVEKCRLPVFRMGATICMRRSTWFEWVKAQERKAAGPTALTPEPQLPTAEKVAQKTGDNIPPNALAQGAPMADCRSIVSSKSSQIS